MRIRSLSVAAVFLIAAVSAQAVTYEYQRLYRDPKTMGAGGAGVAAGGGFGALFSNPAGLARIPKEYGWEFQILNVAASANERVTDLRNIIDDAKESEAKAAESLRTHIGDSFNVGISATPLSAAKKFDKAAFGIGAISSANVSATVHQGFGSSGLLETNVFAVGGAVGGFAYDFTDLTIGSSALNTLSVGVGAKALRYGTFSRTFSAADLANDEFDRIEDEINDKTDYAYDLGFIYDVVPNFSVGASAINIGGIGDDALETPMTLNVGASYVYRVEDRSFFNQVRISADYIDITKEYPDGSYVKRTRFGADLNVWDGWASAFAVQAGLYQGEWTAGASLRIALVDLAFATYAEELGAYSGQDGDRRYAASFGINW